MQEIDSVVPQDYFSPYPEEGIPFKTFLVAFIMYFYKLLISFYIYPTTCYILQVVDLTTFV